MEFEQIIKRLEWLDKQQRENQEVLTKLSAKIDSVETTVAAVSKQVKPLSKQISEITLTSQRTDQFESLLTRQRNELTKLIEETEKAQVQADKEVEKRFKSEMLEIQKSMAEVKKASDQNEVKKQIKARETEIQRVITNMNDLKLKIDEVARAKDDTVYAVKAVDEARKNDIKRVADIQGEVTALRKRIDENRDKATITADTVKNIEGRFASLLASEQERKQAQAAFLEQQSIAQINRDRAWKEWKDKYESFQKEAASLDLHIQNLDEALRGAKKAQEAYLELNTKLERRINEVTEMQRLAEDRQRQEWASFKADDQKRWTGYNLSNEEAMRDLRKDIAKTESRIPPISDSLQVLQDQMQQTTDVTEKELQDLMNVVHEWMTSYQRIMGHGKQTKK